MVDRTSPSHNINDSVAVLTQCPMWLACRLNVARMQAICRCSRLRPSAGPATAMLRIE